MAAASYPAAVVTIRSVTGAGEGVGTLPDGCVVFVPRTAPGDEVEVEITQRRRRWARGRLVSVRRPGPGRRQPPCPYYARCGGCTLQHLDEDVQRRIKAELVGEALRRQAGVRLPQPPPVVPSPTSWHYRNRMTFTLRRRGAGVVAGLHALACPTEVVDVDERCLLPEPAVGTAWARVRSACRQLPELLPPTGEVRLTLRATGGGETAIVAEGGGEGWSAQPLVRASGPWHGAWQRNGRGRMRRLAGREVWDEVGGEPVPAGASSFLQVNRGAAALLYDHVLSRVGEVRGVRVVEAYAGAGVLARRLARAGAVVAALEGHPLAARAAGIGGRVRVLTGPVERHLPAVLPATVVILNPPRSGITPAVAEALRAQPPRQLLYVSCDPATLARDLARLGDRFTVEEVRCVDLFPQTAHVETVASLACAAHG